MRLTNIKTLKLPSQIEAKVAQIIHEKRMLWEPWIEGAASNEALSESLKKRGFKSVPVKLSPSLGNLNHNLAIGRKNHMMQKKT